jgi:hypothetical protein
MIRSWARFPILFKTLKTSTNLQVASRVRLRPFSVRRQHFSSHENDPSEPISLAINKPLTKNPDQLKDRTGGKVQSSEMKTNPISVTDKISARNELFTRDRETIDMIYDSFIAEKLSKCSTPDIARFIRLSGNKMNRRLSKRLKQHLPAIALQLHSMSDVPWKMMHISFVIYGLQCFQETDDGYLNILATMSKLATKTLDKDEKARLDPRDISMLLQGLQSNRCVERESRELVLCIARMLRSIPESIEAQGIGNALYGLQSMNSDSVEVLILIEALTPKVEGCQKPLSALDIGLALYGLRGQ